MVLRLHKKHFSLQEGNISRCNTRPSWCRIVKAAFRGPEKLKVKVRFSHLFHTMGRVKWKIQKFPFQKISWSPIFLKIEAHFYAYFWSRRTATKSEPIFSAGACGDDFNGVIGCWNLLNFFGLWRPRPDHSCAATASHAHSPLSRTPQMSPTLKWTTLLTAMEVAF